MVTLFNAPLFLAAFLQVGVRAAGPVVGLGYATSTLGGASTDGLDKSLKIPYARPPIGDLRFRRLQPPLPLPTSARYHACERSRARVRPAARGHLTSIVALAIRRPRPLETVVHGRTSPCPKFRTSTTLRRPHSPECKCI